jgi:hypothetical protein
MDGAVGVFEQVGLAEDHGAGVLEPAHERGIIRRHPRAVGAGGAGRRHARDVDQVLDRHGDAVQWSAVAAGRQLPFGGSRLSQAFLLEHSDEAVQ